MDSLLLNFEDVARLVTFSRATIENWAYRRKPAPQGFPAPVKVGRILRYRRDDIKAWISSLDASDSVTPPQKNRNPPNVSLPAKRPRGRPRLLDGVNRG